MDELERLRTSTFIARNRIAELQQQLEAAERRIRELTERFTLTQQERSILHGHSDGCIRVGELEPILKRIFGDRTAA